MSQARKNRHRKKRARRRLDAWLIRRRDAAILELLESSGFLRGMRLAAESFATACREVATVFSSFNLAAAKGADLRRLAALTGYDPDIIFDADGNAVIIDTTDEELRERVRERIACR